MKYKNTMLQFAGFAAIAIIATTICFPIKSLASLQNEMNNMFNVMTNVSEGGYHQAMGRGGVAGPSISMRSGRVRTDLINFVPPSIKAGCGGIDMFMGSISFIDADQFVNLLQHIATNASGYAFKMALSVMCPTCDNIISTLQRSIQKLNAMAGDSCRIAEGAVNYMAKELDTAGLSKAIEDGPLGSITSAIGEGVGAFDSFLDKINKGSNSEKMTEADMVALMGNVAWKVLKKDGFIGSAFSFGDNELAEALMSVTGTIVGYKRSENAQSPGIDPWSPILKMKDMLEGANPDGGTKPQRYLCLNSDCTAKNTVDYDFKGLERFIKDTLLGLDGKASGEDSFIYKLLNNTGSLTTKEKQLIRIAPYHMTRMRNMAVCAGIVGNNMGSVPTYAQTAARMIAIEVLQRYVKDALTAINQIANGTGSSISEYNFSNPLIPKYLADLKEVQKDLNREASGLESELPTALEEIYNGATKNCNLTPAHLNIPKYNKQ